MSKVNIYKSNLSNLIKKRRKELGYTRKEFANLIGKRVKFVENVELKQVNNISLSLMLKIADILKVNVFHFIRKDISIKEVLKWLD